jgi:tRNA threonylcarbamoyl adenosine modification protein YeaZ
LPDGPLLAIDTSSDWVGVAVSDHDRIVEENWWSGREQTRQVLAVIDRLMRTIDLYPMDLAAVVVAIGPGSFSGLRVGIGIAEGIELAAGCPVVPVNTFVSTFASLGDQLQGFGVIRAGRNRLVWAHSSDVSQHRSGTIDDLLAAVEPGSEIAVAGEINDDEAERLRIERGAIIRPAPARYRQAGALISAGRALLDRGGISAGAPIQPIYLHPSAQQN